ncbi:MAG: L-threonylcarbamoyladenylate synthase, partial [Chloroflexota bacterium]
PASEQTTVLPIDPERPDPAALALGGQLLHEGRLVAFPTETVYGLGANAFDDQAVRRIFAAKGRAANDPIIVHIANAAHLSEVVLDTPDIVHALAARFWPGPLTVVLPKSPRIPDSATAGLPTVAVRVPRHPVAQGLLGAAGVPIAAPSANTFTRTSATTAAHVLEDLGGKVALILDGGPAPIGIESTVIQITGDEVRLLRPGAVPAEAVDAVLAEFGLARATGTQPARPAGSRAAAGTVQEAAPALSPGQMLKHYAPRARVLYFEGPAEPARAAMRQAVRDELARGHTVGLLLCHEDGPLFTGLVSGAEPPGQLAVEELGSCADLAVIGQRLFAAMRRLDARGVDVICARSLPTGGMGLAIADRLTRAAGGNVIHVP